MSCDVGRAQGPWGCVRAVAGLKLPLHTHALPVLVTLAVS